MMRIAAVAGALMSVLLLVGGVVAADKKNKTGNNQMVRGTIKSVNVKDGVLVVSQKLKGEAVDRQLDIKDVTEFVITVGNDTKELTGKDGLAMLEGKEGASVAVKCDKDVNVLKVTVKLKK